MSLYLLASTGEKKVNADGSFVRTQSALAGLSNGGWVVTWVSSESSSGDIYQRWYDKDGLLKGSGVVNGSTTNAQSQPDVARLANGGWIVTWASKHTGFEAIAGRVFNGSGTGGSDLLLGAPSVGGERRDPAIGTFFDDSKGFAVAWTTKEVGSSGGYDVRVGKFNLDGTLVGIQTFDSTNGQPDPLNERHPTLVGRPDGTYGVAWDNDRVTSETHSRSIQATVFSADGTPDDPVFVDASKSFELNTPKLTALGNGKLIIAYQSQNLDMSGYGIAHAVSPDGTPAKANTAVANDQINASVAALATGGYVVVWQSKNQDGSGWGIYQQRFLANGVKIGSEMRVNESTTGDQVDPDVTALTDGSWVVSWTSGQSDPLNPDIYQRRYTPTDVSLSKINVAEKGDLFIGFLQPTTAYGSTVSWTLDDNADGRFALTAGNQISIADPAQIDADEDTDYYTITVTASAGGLTETRTFTLDRINFNEAPSQPTMSDGGTVVENAGAGNFVAQFVATDPDKGETLTYSLTVNEDGAFEIDASTGKLTLKSGTLNYEAKKQYQVKVKVDDGEKSAEKTFTIFVADANEGPTVLTLSGTSVKELEATGTVVGTLAPADPGAAAQPYAFKLVNDAGGRFAILGDKLVVNNGVALDFEQASAHQITVVGTDQDGLSKTQNLIVNVANVSPEKTSGTAFADTVFGDIGKDVLSGGGGNDVLKGFKNADTLTGGAGNDKLFGGLGKDKLLGGKGKDVFVFDTKPASANVDTLKDFSHKDDTVWLENAIFKGIGSGTLAKPKKMKADAFFLGKEAHDANDRILYDKKTGGLWYDADGSGAHAAVKIAVLSNKPALTLSDFYVI